MKLKLLGHIIRASKYDPMRQVLFGIGTECPRIVHRKRSGKPRREWLSEAMQLAHNHLNKTNAGIENFDINNEQHYKAILDAAKNRISCFSTKPNNKQNIKRRTFGWNLDITSTSHQNQINRHNRHSTNQSNNSHRINALRAAHQRLGIDTN